MGLSHYQLAAAGDKTIQNLIVQGLWIGTRLSRMEELSLRSFIANGHEYHLYAYNPIDNVPPGVQIKDGNEIIPATKIFKYRDYDSYSGFSNFFRYKLLLERGGWWADTDLICIRPFDDEAEYVFSSQDCQEGEPCREVVNVGAIKAPRDSEVLRFAWYGCQTKDPAQLSWGEIGPKLFAKSVDAAELTRYVKSPKTFCPIPWFRWMDAINPERQFDFDHETRAVHLWNELWRRGGFDKDDPYHPDCLYERLKSRYLEPASRISLSGAALLENGGAVSPSGTVMPAKPRPVTISALVLTRNSESRLRRCLESIKDTSFVDEIVVCVDDATTDRTFSVAQEFTPHVHHLRTEGYLESALQKCAEFCTGDYILRIDDDESLGGNWDRSSFELLASLNNFVQFWLPRRWLVPPGDIFIADGPWFPDLQLRLFANESSKIHWPKAPHEEMHVGGRSLNLFDRWIVHHALVDRSRGERRRRCEEYRRLNQLKDFAYVYLYEGLEYTTLPCSTTAIDLARSRPEVSAFCYPPGSRIDFSTNGNGADYIGKGWGLPESWGTWTIADEAEICLPLRKPLGSSAILSAEVMPFLTPLHPRLSASVLYNGASIAEWVFDRSGMVSLSENIPASIIADDPEPCFRLRIAEPRTPAETGDSPDTRMLGLGFKSLSLRCVAGRDAGRHRDETASRESESQNAAAAIRPGRSRAVFVENALRMGSRILPQSQIDVFWDEMWIFRAGKHYRPMPGITEPEPWIWREVAISAVRRLQEAEENWFRFYRPQPGDVVVDIGAGCGEDTQAFAKSVGDSGQVIAIEPDPISCAALRKFCYWNGLTNVVILNAACQGSDETLQLETANWTPNYTGAAEPIAASIEVPAVTFDRIWEEHGARRIGLLKMNLEGGERAALVGCERALEHTRAVVVTTHDHRADRGDGEHFRTGEFVRGFLHDCGFQLFKRDDPRAWARNHVHGVRPEFDVQVQCGGLQSDDARSVS